MHAGLGLCAAACGQGARDRDALIKTVARAYIALGANLGDRIGRLRAAARELGELGAIAARSSVWETEAVGPPPDYLNAVVAIDVDLQQ